MNLYTLIKAVYLGFKVIKNKYLPCNKELLDSDLVIKPFPLATKNGVRMYKRKFHYDCLPKYIRENGNVENRESEKSDWDQLYQYFKKEILGLSDGTKLDKHPVERLLGMRVGRYKPNATNTRTIKQGYPFKVILNTFKFKKSAIDHALKTVNFKNQEHEVDYIMKIVEGDLAFIQKRMEIAERNQKRIEKIKKEEATTRSTAYKSKGTGKRKVAFD